MLEIQAYRAAGVWDKRTNSRIVVTDKRITRFNSDRI